MGSYRNLDALENMRALYADAGHLDWFAPTEQAVFSITADTIVDVPGTDRKVPFSWLSTAKVDDTGEGPAVETCLSLDLVNICNVGLDIGGFSTSTTVSAQNPTACNISADGSPGDCPYNPQIANLATDSGGDNAAMAVWSVRRSVPNSGDFATECRNNPGLDSKLLPTPTAAVEIQGWNSPGACALGWFGGSALHVGDLLGNSVRLGEPTVLRIRDHSQPQTIIQAPPSLIDYVRPEEAESPSATIVNFTRAPTDFNTKVDFATTRKDTASTSMTSSYAATLTRKPWTSMSR